MTRNRGPRRPQRPLLERLEARSLLSGDMVLQWNAVALDAVAADGTGAPADQAGPTRASRALAIVQAAVFDAVNSIDGSYTPYLIRVKASSGDSIEAAAARAAHDTLVALFPHQADRFDAALADALAGIPPRRARQGIAVGQAAAAALLAARADDSSDADVPYTPGTGPGQHRADPLHPDQGFLTPGWGQVTPFVMDSGSKFHVGVPELTSQEYTDAFQEVKAYGGDGVHTPTLRTPEQTTIGIFWAYDGSPGVGTPPRLYNQIVRVIAQQEGNTEVENARLFALVNIAMADAGIASWETKYTDNFWRPVVGIRNADIDGNDVTVADPYWRPLGAPRSNTTAGDSNYTPPFPSCTSGHATFGAAVFQTLRNFYGTDAIPFRFTSDEFNGRTTDEFGVARPVVTRSFATLSQAEEENGQSRIYLGIHWRFDKTEGIQQGEAVANDVFARILRPAGPA
jgi:hypothetical protein